MRGRPYLCNGQATGRQCKFYWHTIIPVDVMNASALRQGETARQCIRHPSLEVRLTAEDGGLPEMATVCNLYEASRRRYDEHLEEYNPLTPEEIEALQEGEAITVIKSKKPSVMQRLAALFSKE
jgi:hypothetical protein